MGNKAKNIRKKDTFSIATFNVRGLTHEYKQKQLVRDIEKYEIDICCLQETKIAETKVIIVNGSRLITVGTDIKEYGNGFLISKKWKDSVHRYWRVSDRICVIQLKTSKSKDRHRNTKHDNYQVTKINDTKNENKENK